jgi:hypothetical protein
MTNKIKVYELITNEVGGVSNSPYVIAVMLYLKHKVIIDDTYVYTFTHHLLGIGFRNCSHYLYGHCCYN